MTKYIFVTGGVVSSLGKGISASSIGKLLQSRGLHVSMLKCDPYINVDPGTMNPFEHGEVFVLDDGAETDLDLGHYERFTDESLHRGSNVLGFLVGIGLVRELTRAGLVVALVAILFLHLLAETVTLSAVIRAVPPLRWLDLAGRPRHPVPAEGTPRSEGSPRAESSPPAEGSDSMKSRGA